MILPIRILLIHKIFPIPRKITQLLLSLKSQPNFNRSHPQRRNEQYLHLNLQHNSQQHHISFFRYKQFHEPSPRNCARLDQMGCLLAEILQTGWLGRVRIRCPVRYPYRDSHSLYDRRILLGLGENERDFDDLQQMALPAEPPKKKTSRKSNQKSNETSPPTNAPSQTTAG
jgi:hypothetical protein